MAYPVTEPFDSGLLPVGDGHEIYWERVGNPAGKPAVVLHGGPGSGAPPFWRTFLDPDRYCMTLFDQRGCGRSGPLASEPDIDLATITTQRLIHDIEELRALHGVERWLVLGASWGSTLALAYAVECPSQVSELALWAVLTTTPHEVSWLTWTMGEVYPEAFSELLALVPDLERGGNVPAAYNKLLMSGDPELQERAAQAWCDWVTRLDTLSGPPRLNPRYADPAFRLGYARIFTHIFGHHGFLPPDGISGRISRIRDVPAVFIRGRLDIASPLGECWRLAQQLPLCSLHVVEDEDHGGAAITYELLIQATDRFALRR